MKKVEDAARVQLSEALEIAREVGMVTVTGEVVEGPAPYEIVSGAKLYGADLIVVGAREMTGLKKWILGSVSSAIVEEPTIHVLVVK